MLLENIHGVIRRIDYTLTDADIDIWAQQCILAVENETFDFSTKVKEVFTQSGKRRVIYHYPKLSVENFICHYLKKRLDKVFKIEYASRSKIINLLFNTIPALKNMNDFVIIRADFKSFFDSVLSRFVYEKYVLPSLLPRGDKDILEKYIDEYKYCYAGLCLSNGMTEIVCRDFDKKLKSKYYNDIKTTIEQILAKRIEAIRVQKSIFEYREFWWVLVFNKCPLLSSTSQILINVVINSLPYTGTGNRNCADIALDVFVDYLKNNGEQFFEWDMSRKDFLRTITFKTHEKSIFKNYKESVASLVWGSI